MVESRAVKKKSKTGLKINAINPLTENQATFLDNYEQYDVLSLIGSAGTGKTFLALYKALDEHELDDTIEKVTIIRSTVETRQQGFQPGDVNEKIAVYEGPYVENVNKLFGRSDAYNILKNKKQIEFVSTAFLRGSTFDNQIVIADEVQNMSDRELDTILTRFGSNCRMILCGDTRQDDLTSERFKEHSGLPYTLSVLSEIKEAKTIIFNRDDIVRSGFVKSYLIAKEEVENKNYR